MRIRSFLKLISIAVLSTALSLSPAQQPQTQTAPISAVNAKYVNGVAPGYAPTAGSGLVLNVSPGTAFCNHAVTQYAGGTLTLTASTTNNIYLNSSASCAPATKTTAFTALDVPIAVVTTSGSAITSILDVRGYFRNFSTVATTGSYNDLLSQPTLYSLGPGVGSTPTLGPGAGSGATGSISGFAGNFTLTVVAGSGATPGGVIATIGITNPRSSFCVASSNSNHISAITVAIFGTSLQVSDNTSGGLVNTETYNWNVSCP